MLMYLVKRLFYFIPTLLLIMLLTFFISINTPGDPVQRQLRTAMQSGPANATDYWQAYERQQKTMGLHLPVFYGSLTRLSNPDTLHHIAIPAHRAMLDELIWTYGNWPEVQHYYRTARHFYSAAIAQNLGPTSIDIGYDLLTLSDASQLKKQIDQLEKLDLPEPSMKKEVVEAFNAMHNNATEWKNYVPALHWHGMHNQFHHWLFGNGADRGGIIAGDFGKSYRSRQPVTSLLSSAMQITLQLTLTALILALLIAIPLGIVSGAHKDQWLDNGISSTLFVLHGLPSFWIGTLLIIFLGGGDFLNWFPPYGLGNIQGLSFWQGWQVRLSHLVLPIFCLVYPILAYLSRQARGGVVTALQQPFITTARAKGLTERQVVWKHGFRNALLPIITLIGNMLPFAIGGSVIIEVIFSIPGMGKVTLNALYARDYPVVFSAVLITSFITMLGYLLADVLYKLADPRVSYKKQRS